MCLMVVLGNQYIAYPQMVHMKILRIPLGSWGREKARTRCTYTSDWSRIRIHVFFGLNG